MKLSPAQWFALAAVAVPGDINLSGVRGTTIGALSAAGLVKVRRCETTESYRPSRSGFTSARWTRSRSYSDVQITDAGRAALVEHAPWAAEVSRRCAAMAIGGVVRLFRLVEAARVAA